MEKKRSKGITIFSWLIITGSILGLLSCLTERTLIPPILIFLYVIIYPTSIAIAIYLMKLRKWARIAIIVISIVVAAATVATAPYLINANKKYVNEMFDEWYKEGYEEGIERAKKIYSGKAVEEATVVVEKAKIKETTKSFSMILVNILSIAIPLISIGFNCGVIYFFTRPKVKEQFR